MADIKIKVEGRIATNLTPEVKLVTKNDGYSVEFEFDETWSVSSLKTALFIANGHCIPVPFVGNVCNVPMLVGVELLNVGVKSDDVLGLQTTTAAKVLCVLSADDLVVDEITAPSQSIYDRIVEMINEGMVKGEKGDKGDKGEKGDAGAIKFVTVVSLPTENIQDDAIYLVPIENADGENRFTEYAYIDGKWETLGAISIQVDHSEYVKFTDRDTFVKGGVTENTETLTDEEKASACEWLGALQKVGGKTTYDQMWLRKYTGEWELISAHAGLTNDKGVVMRTSYGGIKVRDPLYDDEAVGKGWVVTYVDGKYAELLARIEALETK